MASVTIARDAGHADMLRQYEILLDGAPVGNLGEGEASTFPLPAGEHQLKARIDWCGSKPVVFAVKEGDAAKFVVESNLRGVKAGFVLWYIAFARQSYLRLRQVQNFDERGTASVPQPIDRTQFILKHGVLRFGLFTGIFWIIGMYLLGHPMPLPLMPFVMAGWLLAGAGWGAIMWRFFNRRFGAEIGARNARLEALAAKKAQGSR